MKICRAEWMNTRMYSVLCDCEHCVKMRAIATAYAFRDSDEYQDEFERDAAGDDE